jgi:hypothetical protein
MVRQGTRLWAAQMFPCDACAINGQIRGGAGAVSHSKETWSSVEGAGGRRASLNRMAAMWSQQGSMGGIEGKH